MNPFVMRFADGTSFQAGLLLVILGAGLGVALSGRVVRAICFVVMLAGTALAVLSSTPLSAVAYLLWVLLAGTAGIVLNLPSDSRLSRRKELIACSMLTILTLLLFVREASLRFCPRVDVAAGQPVYVVGDSLSAGVHRGERCWPAVLADLTGLTVTNLAVAGAKTKDALSQIDRIGKDGSLVIVEIGGNDLLGGTAVEQFRENLDSLLARLRRQGHRVIMFELPLPPLRSAWGRVQRKLAGRYEVALIPKHVLGGALSGPGATVDGLHFSQSGHEHLARRVREVLVGTWR